MLNSHDNFARAYISGLSDLIRSGRRAPPIADPLSPASHFGTRPRASVEIIPYGFEIKTPKPSIIVARARPLNLRYLFGQLVWFIAGSESLEFLSYYNAAASAFSHDKSTLCGSFGRRIFGADPGKGQAAAAVELLKRDPGSRRAFISVLDANDLLAPTRETPCNCGMHFFVREGALEVVCHMRAQQALNILPYDVLLFVVFQQIVASELNVRVGKYFHLCGTFHFYEDEIGAAKQVIADDALQIVLPDWTGGLAIARQLIAYENELRAAAIANDLQAAQDIYKTYDTPDRSLARVIRDVLYVVALKKMKVEYLRNPASHLLRELGMLKDEFFGDTL